VDFDDRAADHWSHSHAVGLCRVEWFKETRKRFRAYPRAGVLNTNAQIVQFGLTCGDEHLSSALTCAHCLQGVENEIKDDLLKLDPITFNDRQAFREFGRHRDPVLQCLSSNKLNHFSHSLVHIYAVGLWRCFLHERTHSTDNGTGSVRIAGSAGERFSDLLQIWRVSIQET
jgi:hypothetical protein